MLRSAINNSALMAVAGRTSLAPSSVVKSSLSKISCNISSMGDICRNVDSNISTPVIFASDNNSFTINNIKSSLCNLIAYLSGDVTLISLDQKLSQNEEEMGGDITNLSVLEEEETSQSLSLWLISTLKRRKKMMNKHKLRKRRKKLRMRTRK